MKYCRIFADTDINCRDLRIAVCCSICSIKVSHTLNAVLADFQRESHKVIDRQTVIKCFSKSRL